MAAKRKKQGRQGIKRRSQSPARGPGRPEKPLEKVPYSFDEIVQALVKPVPKEGREPE